MESLEVWVAFSRGGPIHDVYQYPSALRNV